MILLCLMPDDFIFTNSGNQGLVTSTLTSKSTQIIPDECISCSQLSYPIVALIISNCLRCIFKIEIIPTVNASTMFPLVMKIPDYREPENFRILKILTTGENHCFNPPAPSAPTLLIYSV